VAAERLEGHLQAVDLEACEQLNTTAVGLGGSEAASKQSKKRDEAETHTHTVVGIGCRRTASPVAE